MQNMINGMRRLSVNHLPVVMDMGSPESASETSELILNLRVVQIIQAAESCDTIVRKQMFLFAGINVIITV